MELLAAIAGLEELKQPCRVTVSSDSRYLVNSMTRGWLQKWKGLGWRRGPGQRLRNEDLWKRLDAACGGHELHWEWVKGHAGHAENECCDALAVEAAEGRELPADEGYLDEEQFAGEEPGLFD